MDFANRLVSYNVIEWELSRCADGTAPISSVAAAVGMPSMRQEALTMRREMLQLQVETGSLSFEAYLQALREAIPKEKARSKELKGRPGGARRALDAFKHAQIMQKELTEALEQGEQQNDDGE